MWALLLAACSSVPAPVALEAVVLEPGAVHPVPARSHWPTDGWERRAPEEVGLDPEALARLDAYAFSRTGDDADRRGQRTNALLIVKDGFLVHERYARGYDAETPLLTWSVTKSVVSTLYGAAVHDGLVDVNAPACRYYAPLCREGHDRVRITDLLRMSSGLAWAETYETSPIFSSVMAMLYTRGHEDMAAFAASRPLAHPPGTHWSYSSGDTNLLSAALRGAVGEDAYPDWPWQRLFDRIGMRDVTLERDGAGTFVGSSYLYAPAPALAKWGFLYLNDGVWDGERLLAEGWVDYAATLAPAFHTTPVRRDHHEDNPGAQIYLNVGDPERGLAPPWPALPADAMGASGHWGKAIWMIPSWDMVVVRMGDDREYGCAFEGQTDCVADPTAAFTKSHFLALLAEAVP